MNTAWARPDKFFGWKALSVTAVMYFAWSGIMLYSFPVIMPHLHETFGWSRASISWANSLAMVVQGLVMPFAGVFVMRYGAKKVLAAGGILSVLCFVAASFHTSLWELYLAYGILFGVGGSLCGMLAMTTIANNWFVKKRSLALSILLTAGGFGGLVMVPMMTATVNQMGWRNAYLILAAIIFVLLFLVPSLLIVNKPEELGQSPDGTRVEDKKAQLSDKKNLYGPPVDFTAAEAIRTSAFWYITIASTAFMVGMQGFMLHQLIFLDDINIPKTTASIAYGVFVGVSTMGRLGMGFLGIRYHSRPLTIIGYVVLVSGFAIMLFAKTLPMVFLYNIIIGLGMGGIYVAKMNIVPAFFGKTYYPKIAGFTLPFATLIGSIGSPLTGRIRDVTGSYEMAWQLAIIIIAIGLVAMILARPPIHPSLKKTASVSGEAAESAAVSGRDA